MAPDKACSALCPSNAKIPSSITRHAGADSRRYDPTPLLVENTSALFNVGPQLMDSVASLTPPTSFRLAVLAQNAYDLPLKVFEGTAPSHPSVSHLVLLVFEAVLEVVCVSLPGYIVARLGHFDADKQKFLANLNVMLFTPCLIFTKLASQLNAEKLSELAIIPAIFFVQTLVSWLVSILVAKGFRFNKRASNFVTAMGVFGNSNSLPISLVLSLSQTIKGLHWDRIPGDNDDEVGARGILYLLIFQQLGQLVRWSWGYHVLLAPKDKYPEYQDQIVEEGEYRYRDEDPSEQEPEILIDGLDGDTEDDNESNNSDDYIPAGRTPIANTSRASLAGSAADNDADMLNFKKANFTTHGHTLANTDLEDDILSFPRIRLRDEIETEQGALSRAKKSLISLKERAVAAMTRQYQRLPQPVRSTLSFIYTSVAKTINFVWEFMNPPLWAMLFAVVVASVPKLQQLFFEDGSFVKNSVTNAVQSSGGVAVPLILVVLGANLARNTAAHETAIDPEEEEIGTKLLIASLLSRMVLPTIIMAPILAITAKYLPISILDDPIFIVVCFLLTGAPSALQLAQICQINNVYEKTMGRILFQSYVIWILPSTLILVMMALEVIEWATAN
ncbi:auxin efflux carrier superfamily [Trichoderma arundinaceum]|uniref:Auxin efflux carrier superfamily n=1 Tax=Trichoderma arundinaceum TaxID=490622 RepID=A0A395N7Y5_TRIAR|nr:auxin efflux carrier superfamily [Trichoderma arundinaceum]